MNIFEKEEAWKLFQKWKIDSYDVAAIWYYFARINKLKEWEYLYNTYIKPMSFYEHDCYLDYDKVYKEFILKEATERNDSEAIKFINEELSIFSNKFIILF